MSYSEQRLNFFKVPSFPFHAKQNIFWVHWFKYHSIYNWIFSPPIPPCQIISATLAYLYGSFLGEFVSVFYQLCSRTVALIRVSYLGLIVTQIWHILFKGTLELLMDSYMKAVLVSTCVQVDTQSVRVLPAYGLAAVKRRLWELTEIVPLSMLKE